jgi:hypothetical protein
MVVAVEDLLQIRNQLDFIGSFIALVFMLKVLRFSKFIYTDKWMPAGGQATDSPVIRFPKELLQVKKRRNMSISSFGKIIVF